MFIATPHELRIVADPDNPEDVNHRYKLASVWTKSEPTLLVVYRMKQLAGVALSLISESVFSSQMDFTVSCVGRKMQICVIKKYLLMDFILIVIVLLSLRI